jgi:hypothetical protein
MKGNSECMGAERKTRGSGLTQVEALRGLGRVQGISRGLLDNIKVIGYEFFINRAIGGL